MFAEHVGKVGKDARGMRFLVLDVRNIRDAGYDPGFAVVVLPDSRPNAGAPGTVLHASWVEQPVEWAA